MRTIPSNRYIFSAYANSVGAVLHEPLKAFLSDVPCAALPVHGGLISQVKENIKLHIESKAVLRVRRATSTVHGEWRDDHYVSLAESTVERINLLDVVTADAIISRVVSVYYPAGEKPEDSESSSTPVEDELAEQPPPRSRFFVTGSHFDNLKIDGKLFDCHKEPLFEHKDGFSAETTEDRPPSLFADCRANIHIPQFGTIHLGEVYIYSSKIILTMLRVELGCPINGSVSAGNTSTNGKDGHH